VILNIPNRPGDISFGDLWHGHLWENNYEMFCPMCASGGLKRILKYHFAENNYLLLSFVHGVSENGIQLSRSIVEHPEEAFRLQGMISLLVGGLNIDFRNVLEGYSCDLL
jgi:hypothetical protein